jgi:putative transposase
MPRKARLDIPGLLQHVIVRGIDRRKIFRDDIDRSRFVKKLSDLLIETETDCFAWALIPNHFHLLVRPNKADLKLFMRRLLTGYAITFNRRHGRSGYLFQNRYKSIVCEEEPYLLELVRYIHLNPLRANLVPDLTTLNRFPWCGHAVLLGNFKMDGQNVEEIFMAFGKSSKSSRYNYLEFIKDGLNQGKRDELVGGGLDRSRKYLPNSKFDDVETSDERVLGSSDFVTQLRNNNTLGKNMTAEIQLPELQGRVEQYLGLKRGELEKRSREKTVAKGRDLFCFIAVRVLHFAGTEAGHVLHIKRSAVSHAIRRGEAYIENDEGLVADILNVKRTVV